MTQGGLDRLIESCFFPSGIQARLPEDNETIVSTRSGKVAFYKAAFHAGLRLPIHSTVKRILNFYNICPIQLSPNAWKSVVYAVAVWRYYKYALSLNEFRHLFILFKNPKPDSGWLYSKKRPSKIVIEGVPLHRQGAEEEVLIYLGRRL